MKTIKLTQAAFDLLPEYSSSLPSATTIGKQWKRQLSPYAKRKSGKTHDWEMAEYVPDPKPGYVGILWRIIEISEDGLGRDEICNPADWVTMFRMEREKRMREQQRKEVNHG